MNLLETNVAIEKLFDRLKGSLEPEITHALRVKWKIPTLSETDGIGKQIQYYRRLANIKQEDLCERLGCERGAIRHIESGEMKLVDVDFLKRVLRELGIEDKIVINDDYIDFLLHDPSKAISDYKEHNNLSTLDLSKMIGVDKSVIRKWETGKSQITRTSYNKLKQCMK